MTTTHANCPTQALQRLETLCLFAGAELPLQAIRRQIANSIHLIVQQNRFSDGQRKVTAISEVLGMRENGYGESIVELRPIFRAEKVGSAWEQRATGYAPSFLDALQRLEVEENDNEQNADRATLDVD